MVFSKISALPTKGVRKGLVRIFLSVLLFSFFAPIILGMWFPELFNVVDHEGFAINFLGALIGWLIIYLCAYRKPGTRWLTFTIWCYVISMTYFIVVWLAVSIIFCSSPKMFITGFVRALEEKASGQSLGYFMSFYATNMVCNLIMIGLGLMAFCYEIVLRKRNNLFQYKKTLKTTAYKEAYAQIDSATHRAHLDSLYAQLKKQFPRIKKFLRFKWKKKKTDF